MKAITKGNIQLAEVVIWMLLALLAASAIRTFRPMPLGNDSYQYLNVAEHFRHDHHLTTSLVNFDTERSHGRIPAPLSTFPVGYPFVVAILANWSDFEGTARFLSGVCYACVTGLLAYALILVGVTPFLRQLTLLIFVTNAVALSFATAVMTEPLYLFLSTGAVVGLLWADQEALSKRTVIARAAIASSAAGLAYWVRYAGIFLIVAVVSCAILRLLKPGSRLRAVFPLAALIPITLAGILMARNVITVGTWKGGNEMPVHNPVNRVIVDYVKAQLHLVLGPRVVAFDVWLGLLLAGGLVITVVLLRAAGRGGVPKTGAAWVEYWRQIDTKTLMIAVCVLVYSAGVFYAGLSTVISFGTRMFLPMLPLYLLLFGIAGNWLISHRLAGTQGAWLRAGFLLVTVGYVAINARNLYQHPFPAHYELLAAEYRKPAANGLPLMEWVESHTSDGEAIVAEDGQATGYLLHRPTVSMVTAEYSPVRWECGEVKKEMKRFKASYLFLYKPSFAGIEGDLVGQSRFVADSVVSPQPPCGFVIAAENAGVRILESQAKD